MQFLACDKSLSVALLDLTWGHAMFLAECMADVEQHGSTPQRRKLAGELLDLISLGTENSLKGNLGPVDAEEPDNL
jgi:hypothetical protein